MNSLGRGRPVSLAKLQQSFAGDQPDLFSNVGSISKPAEFFDLDIAVELLASVKQALRLARNRGMSVDRVADRMNTFLPEDKRITSRQIYGWCALSREQHRFPAELIPCFCWAAECDAPLRLMANAIGLDLVDGREQVAKRLGQNLIERARLAREERELKQRLST